MSLSKESTVVVALVFGAIFIGTGAGCSENGSSGWDSLFGKKESPRKVEPQNGDEQTARANQPKQAANSDKPPITETSRNTEPDGDNRGDPSQIEAYAANVQPRQRNNDAGNADSSALPSNTSGSNPPPVVSNGAMSPVTTASDRSMNSGNGAGVSTPTNSSRPSNSTASNDSPWNNEPTQPSPVRTAADRPKPAGSGNPIFIDNSQLKSPPRDDSPNDMPVRPITNDNSNRKTGDDTSNDASSDNSGAPVLASVTAEASRNPSKTTNNNSTAVSSPDQSDSSDAESSERRREIADQESKVASNPDDVQALFKLRTMYLIDNRDEEAFAPMKGVPEDIQEIVLGQLRSFSAARQGSTNNPATWANRQLEAMRELQEKLRAKADLIIPKMVLCTEIVKFGQYTPFESIDFKAGLEHAILIYVEVDNFKSERTSSGEFRTKLGANLSILSDSGELLAVLDEEPLIEDFSRGVRRDFFMAFGPIEIPATFPVGTYKLKVEISDLLAGKFNSKTTDIRFVP